VNLLSLDKYERQARLLPGLLALLPVVVTVTALGFRQAPVISVAASVLSVAGGAVLLADIVRSLGLKAQRSLWTTWGGAPTTLALRLRETTSNAIQRNLWRDAVQKVTGIQLASARSEGANPDAADQKIEVAVSRLRELTRDEQRFYMVHVENRGYGYRRNLYGVRVFGRTTALLGFLIILGSALWPLVNNKHPDFRVAYTLGLIIDACIMIGWFFLPSPTQVRQAADKYAYQVLQAAVTLAEAPGGTAQSP
jgi:hypothetical protein